jgi:hypothetical protein
MSNEEKSLFLNPNLMKSAITHNVILHHNTYFECQDGTTTEDVINQCIDATHMSTTTTEHEGIVFCDTFQTDIAEAPTSTQVVIPKTTIKRSPDFQLLRPFLDGCPVTLYKRHLNIPPSTHDFTMVPC